MPDFFAHGFPVKAVQH